MRALRRRPDFGGGAIGIAGRGIFYRPAGGEVDARGPVDLREGFRRDQLADHSTNVANISLYLAQSMGYTHQIILENIYLGAILHDLGKTKIDPKVFEMPGSPAYVKAMRMHPTLGKNALSTQDHCKELIIWVL